LDADADIAAVEALFAEAAEFWVMTDRKPPGRATAQAFFTDCPPGCDPALSARLGFFQQDRLIGVAELAYGFPNSEDAYLGLMLFAPTARGCGYGRVFLAEVERLARAKGCPRLLLAVLEENVSGWGFWVAQGFAATGLTGFDADTGHTRHRFSKDL
jgi:GNAT superfamily N-acetyltransferase